jgi:hypothetical protein
VFRTWLLRIIDCFGPVLICWNDLYRPSCRFTKHWLQRHLLRMVVPRARHRITFGNSNHHIAVLVLDSKKSLVSLSVYTSTRWVCLTLWWLWNLLGYNSLTRTKPCMSLASTHCLTSTDTWTHWIQLQSHQDKVCKRIQIEANYNIMYILSSWSRKQGNIRCSAL